MEEEKLTREECLRRLCEKQRELAAAGLTRRPQRADFSQNEVMYIKSFFGPWPHALAAAGLAPSHEEERLAKNRAKRARAEKRRRKAKKAARAAGRQSEAET